MPALKLKCNNCHHIFSSKYNVNPGNRATFLWTSDTCPKCHSAVEIPNGTFKSDKNGSLDFESTVKIIIDNINEAEHPLEEAKNILEILERSKKT